MPKRAQAALEFLTTYGWAFLVIVGAIGALTLFAGPDYFVSDTCIISDSFSCEAYTLKSNDLLLRVKNLVGRSLTISAVECSYDGNEYSNSFGTTIASGETIDLSCNSIANLPEGNRKAKVTFSIVYREAGKGFDSYADGHIILAHTP